MSKWLNKYLREKPHITTDKPDRFDSNVNMSVLSGPFDGSSLQHDFEERLAIAEYDGGQTILHANRIAYLDAFISVLSGLPESGSQRDWLVQQLQIALATLEAQNFPTLN